MTHDTGRIAETILAEDGEVTIALRPGLPFLSESFSFRSGRITVRGGDHAFDIQLEEDVLQTISAAGQILLMEFSENSVEAEREIILLPSF